MKKLFAMAMIIPMMLVAVLFASPSADAKPRFAHKVPVVRVVGQRKHHPRRKRHHKRHISCRKVCKLTRAGKVCSRVCKRK